jgi:SRSO17 transposase
MGKQEAKQLQESELRFEVYLNVIVGSLGDMRRVEPVKSYCTGLLLPGERKSVEPMAAQLAPERVSAKHQSLHNVVANAAWDDAAMLAAVRSQVIPAIERHRPVLYWILDDSGIPKQGKHSVGVARQYCGNLGKVDNCQVAVSLSVANDHASLPIAYRLYLPPDWADDKKRRKAAGVPKEVAFATKPAIALGQIRQALRDGVPVGIVLADAAYGVDTDFRAGVSELALSYVLGVQSTTSVWQPGTGPLPPLPYSGRGRRPTRLRRDAEHQPVSVKDLATGLPASAWRRVAWREGSNGELSSRFAAVRVRPAPAAPPRSDPWSVVGLLIGGPRGEPDPTRHWFSNLPPKTKLQELVRTAKARWIIERDYEELKQEVGLDHFEGRGWRGFHHHASLCIAAYGFLAAERCLFPPQRQFIRERIKIPALPEGFHPRGAAHPA